MKYQHGIAPAILIIVLLSLPLQTCLCILSPEVTNTDNRIGTEGAFIELYEDAGRQNVWDTSAFGEAFLPYESNGDGQYTILDSEKSLVGVDPVYLYVGDPGSESGTTTLDVHTEIPNAYGVHETWSHIGQVEIVLHEIVIDDDGTASEGTVVSAVSERNQEDTGEVSHDIMIQSVKEDTVYRMDIILKGMGTLDHVPQDFVLDVTISAASMQGTLDPTVMNIGNEVSFALKVNGIHGVVIGSDDHEGEMDYDGSGDTAGLPTLLISSKDDGNLADNFIPAGSENNSSNTTLTIDAGVKFMIYVHVSNPKNDTYFEITLSVPGTIEKNYTVYESSFIGNDVIETVPGFTIDDSDWITTGDESVTVDVFATAKQVNSGHGVRLMVVFPEGSVQPPA